MSIIGDNIRALRKRENLTQQDLADIAHVTRETVNKWENGTIEGLREHNITRLRKHFGLTLDDLRSESNGLAAQIRMASIMPNTVIVYTPHSFEVLSSSHAIIDEYLSLRHPHAFAVEMDDSMDRVMPRRCHALVDPDLPARTGSIVYASIDGNSTHIHVVRRLHLGSIMAMLSAESHRKDIEDIVVERHNLRIEGTVFWYQAAKEMT